MPSWSHERYLQHTRQNKHLGWFLEEKTFFRGLDSTLQRAISLDKFYQLISE
ncbi:hypothetical protein AHMF7616_03932 [Adhaeribacter pallidiroseus]|uniref:Uncharacterized protein n=1 Tax=Adhaeribacter pallidiroseus TaxID=2072847 RepID=A0A369QLQ5_9BACT|nr:hypothetical protein AHMF7616_03932 [Adhaeribacter pallidiroseus]